MTTPASSPNSRIDALVDAAMPRVLEVTDDMEFATFQTGCRVPRDLDAADETTREQFRIESRLALLRRLETLWPGRRLVGVGPDVKVTLLPDTSRRVSIFVEPLFVAGRYRKLVRGLSQTAFHCRTCRGRRDGCEACGGARRLVAESVDDFIKPPITAAVRGRRPSFHGAGREDVDVRMLGNGRPFVVSVQWAKRRTLDGDAAAREVELISGGRVVVSDLRVVGRAETRRITTEHGVKTYRAVVRTTDGPPPADVAARLSPLVGVDLRQRTPERVERRRADLVRVRRVSAVDVEEMREDGFVATIRVDAGAYVKELISGDSGRTEPSFASALGQSCVCSELDVISVGGESDLGRAT